MVISAEFCTHGRLLQKKFVIMVISAEICTHGYSTGIGTHGYFSRNFYPWSLQKKFVLMVISAEICTRGNYRRNLYSW